MFGNNSPFSYSSRGVSPEDFPYQRKTFQKDDLGSSLMSNNLSRPSGKSIYMQRKEYSDLLNRQPDNLHVRVEHLFTCELDGREMKKVDDCVAKLKRLDAQGRLWCQQMIMEVQGGYLLLSDIETKIELDSLPLHSIVQTKAVLDSCSYNSLLTITAHDRSKGAPQVFIFQCEEVGADSLKDDLDKALQKRGDAEPWRDGSDNRNNLKNTPGHRSPGFSRPGERATTPQNPLPTQWGNRKPESLPPPRVNTPQEELLPPPGLLSEPANTKRNTEILNHVIGDLEIFVDAVSTAVKAQPTQKDKGKKKKKKPTKNGSPADGMPPLEEYISCLQKVKYGFNLLGQLDGALTKPSASDFVHIFFSCLGMVVPQYPAYLPPSVVSPLLTDATLRLFSNVLSLEEDQLLKSLGDPWNIPSSRWPDKEVPPYTPKFSDGWQLPTPLNTPSVSRSNSQRYTPDRSRGQTGESRSNSPRAMQWQPDEPLSNGAWNSPPPPGSREPPLYMRVIYNFMARNNQELSVMKGDVVQVIQKNKQWWLVRNARGEEGNIPQNVLEPMKNDGPVEDSPWDARGPATLDMLSTPADVKAWLKYKGFSKITVASLGVLNGKMLLGMTKNQITSVCPEEGGRVFFQLQAIRSAVALASEPSESYNRHY